MNGKFIVIEGLDGSGKTTQLTALAQNLRALGYAVAETAEPTASTTGGSRATRSPASRRAPARRSRRSSWPTAWRTT